jgi:hypothetical protein
MNSGLAGRPPLLSTIVTVVRVQLPTRFGASAPKAHIEDPTRTALAMTKERISNISAWVIVNSVPRGGPPQEMMS